MIEESYVSLETVKKLGDKGFASLLGRPTQSIVCRWLRETKKIHILALPMGYDSWCLEIYNSESEMYYTTAGNLKTYEDAIEYGINKVLNEI